jgi:hypothetical protein
MHTDDGETVIMLVEHTVDDGEPSVAPAPGAAAPAKQGSTTDDGVIDKNEKLPEPPHGGNL